MLIKITAQQIEHGTVSESGCPVAGAFRVATGDIWFVYTTYARKFGSLHKFELPPAVAERIGHYDQCREMTPFEFEIELVEPDKTYRSRKIGGL